MTPEVIIGLEAVVLLSSGLLLVLKTEALQKLTTRLPRALIYIWFDFWGVSPMDQRVAFQYRIVGTLAMAMGLLEIYLWFLRK
jgi:hypothetical protein